MPVVDSYLQGTPCWVDLMTTDQAGAKEFYNTVFGWNYQDNLVQDEIYYGMALIDGKNVAGIESINAEQAGPVRPNWNTYLAVDDLDDVMSRVVEAEGR